MAKHLSLIDKLVVSLLTLQGPMDDSRKLVFLLSSLPAENEIVSPIAETPKKVTLMEVTKKILKEYERLEKKETTQRAFKLNAGRFKRCNGNGRKTSGPRRNEDEFKEKCFECGQVGN